MGIDDHDAHDQANAEFIALLKAAAQAFEPWDEADDDAPLADLRQASPACAACGDPEKRNRPGLAPDGLVGQHGDRDTALTPSLQTS